MRHPKSRGITTRTHPRVSVILISVADAECLMSVLEDLVPRLNRYAAELLVVRRGFDVTPENLGGLPGDVTFIKAADDASRGRMRELAASQATGDILIIREDTNAPDPRWLHALSAVSQRSEEVHARSVPADVWDNAEPPAEAQLTT